MYSSLRGGETETLEATKLDAFGYSKADKSEKDLKIPNIKAKPSYDCGKAKTWSEIRVCADITLADLDQQLGSLFREIKSGLKGQEKQQLVVDQKAWLRERENCKNEIDQQNCLKSIYNKRIFQLTPDSQKMRVRETQD